MTTVCIVAKLPSGATLQAAAEKVHSKNSAKLLRTLRCCIRPSGTLKRQHEAAICVCVCHTVLVCRLPHGQGCPSLRHSIRQYHAGMHDLGSALTTVFVEWCFR